VCISRPPFTLSPSPTSSQGDLEGARTLYVEAAGIEPYCVEAIFNLGLLNIREEEYQVGLLFVEVE
jgi:hypothetical protein